MSTKGIPEVTMQMLIDAGFNAFGLQLFAESVAGKTDATTRSVMRLKQNYLCSSPVRCRPAPLVASRVSPRAHWKNTASALAAAASPLGQQVWARVRGRQAEDQREH